MKLSTFSIIWAIIYLGFGLGLLSAPIQFMSPYGITLDDDGALMTRILGAALTTFAISFYLNRGVPVIDKGWYHLLLTSFIYNIVVMPIVLIATLNGVMSSMGWVPVLLHVFLAATFGYFTFKNLRQYLNN